MTATCKKEMEPLIFRSGGQAGRTELTRPELPDAMLNMTEELAEAYRVVGNQTERLSLLVKFLTAMHDLELTSPGLRRMFAVADELAAEQQRSAEVAPLLLRR